MPKKEKIVRDVTTLYFPFLPARRLHPYIAICNFWLLNCLSRASNWALPQTPLRTGALTQTLKPLISHTYKTLPNTPWQAVTNGLGCTLLQHPTSPTLLTSPTPCQSELVCGACIGTAQIGASLVAPIGFIFKRSSLRSFRDMIIIS